ncbi:MAG: hypothetical protein HWQ38_37915 [Nostoc sp. NMS7]|uniref:hypothetical protein n=1 Tax=Nostoc sp. NMS7 TaxID=2815391 RepID=UPI0025FE7878|nr:hypothetical protein [Nostoc sp. NMS7]MBN3951935.1 hypothetical protein [Nostoc sp. NMS7]
MPNLIFTNAWVSQSAKILFRGATPPDATKFRLALANTATLTRSNLLADFLASELLPVNSYARVSTNFSDGSYNATLSRYELPTVSASFAASGGSLQFQTAFLIANSSATASQYFTNANVNPTSDRITLPSHGFVNGDQITFTADALAVLPTGIVAGTVYTAANVTTNDFQLTFMLSGVETGVDITDTGSGTFRARSANGIIVAYAVESTPITIFDGQGYSYNIPLVVLNSGYVTGS